jgi:hypothetical protein
MTECADKQCQKRMVNLEDCMFKDTEGGVRHDIQQIKQALGSVVKMWQVWVVFGALLIAIVPSYVAVARTVFLYTPITETNLVRDRVSRLEEKHSHLLSMMREVRTENSAILRELKNLSMALATQESKQTQRFEYDYNSNETVEMK